MVYTSLSMFIYIVTSFYFLNTVKNPKKRGNFFRTLHKKGITCIVPSFSYTTLGKFDVKNSIKGWFFRQLYNEKLQI